MAILGSLFDGLRMSTPPIFPSMQGSAPMGMPSAPSPTPEPGWLQGFSSPMGQIALSLLANSRRPDGRATPFGQAAGNAVLGYQQQKRDLASEELRKKYMEAQIARMNAPEQDNATPMIVMGQDGKPQYASRQDAIGKQPYMEPKGLAENAVELQLARALSQNPNDPAEVRRNLQGILDKKYRESQSGEPLVAIQTEKGTILVPRSQAAGATPAASREAPSETELTAKNYFDRMQAAEAKLGNYQPSMKDYLASNKVMDGGALAGSLANMALSPEGQLYYQAAADWVRAKLRKESGAVISPQEMAQEIKTYFPLPTDDARTIAQKKQARDQATKGMKDMGGRASRQQPPIESNPQDPLGIR